MPSGVIITSLAPLLAACLASYVRLAGTGITYIFLPTRDCNPALPSFNLLKTPLCVQGFPMPNLYQQDCHYFFRTALRGLSVTTLVSPLHC